MNSEPLLPPRVTRMGEALRPLLSKLSERAAAPAADEAATPVTVEFLSQRLRALCRALTRLDGAVKAMMEEVIANQAADDADVYRTVARLEGRVDDLIDDCADLRQCTAGEFAEAARLLEGVYGELLDRIERWLDDLVESIADPDAAIERRGLPKTGYVELPFHLNLDALERIAELQDWVDRERRRREAGAALAETPTRLAGAIAVNLGSGGADDAAVARLKRFGDAMRPVLATLREALEEPVKPAWSAPNVKTEMARHLGSLERFEERFREAGEIWSEAVGMGQVDERERTRAVTGISDGIRQLLAEYRVARRLNATGRFVRGRDLLVLYYRQTLRQVEKWLLTTVDALEDPLAECERRGLPGNGRVPLLPEVRLTVPSADRKLADWLDEMRSSAEADSEFWNAMIAVGAGVLIGGVLFDD